ncbi:MAG: hypothetical protein ACYTXC_19465 [Nostoc sp.]
MYPICSSGCRHSEVGDWALGIGHWALGIGEENMSKIWLGFESPLKSSQPPVPNLAIAKRIAK